MQNFAKQNLGTCQKRQPPWGIATPTTTTTTTTTTCSSPLYEQNGMGYNIANLLLAREHGKAGETPILAARGCAVGDIATSSVSGAQTSSSQCFHRLSLIMRGRIPPALYPNLNAPAHPYGNVATFQSAVDRLACYPYNADWQFLHRLVCRFGICKAIYRWLLPVLC